MTKRQPNERIKESSVNKWNWNPFENICILLQDEIRFPAARIRRPVAMSRPELFANKVQPTLPRHLNRAAIYSAKIHDYILYIVNL